jgi:hypothetical protein
MVAPVVHRFATTRSYEGARANFPLLQELSAEGWTRELVDIAERATEVNSQLKNANLLHPTRPVPDATAELLAPIRERLGMDVPIDTGIADDDIPF